MAPVIGGVPIGSTVVYFLGGVADIDASTFGKNYAVAGAVAPNGEVWILWFDISVHDGVRVSIYDEDMNHQVTHDLSGLLGVTSYTHNRFDIVVNKSGHAVIAYQVGSSTGGTGTFVRRLTRDGTLGTARLASTNYGAYPKLALWNGCEDVILAMPGTGVTLETSVIPFSVSGQTLGASFSTGDVDSRYGIKHLYYVRGESLFVDPWTNDVHILSPCSMAPGNGSPTGAPYNPFSVAHFYGQNASMCSVMTPPDQFYNSVSKYSLIGARGDIDRRKDNFRLHFVWTRSVSVVVSGGSYGSSDNNSGVAYCSVVDDEWGPVETVHNQQHWPDGVIWDASVKVDGLGNAHIIHSATDCPTRRRANRPDYNACAYGGSGLMYSAKYGTSPIIDAGTLIQAVPCCYSYGDTIEAIDNFPVKNWPGNNKHYHLTRTSYAEQAIGQSRLVMAYNIASIDPSDHEAGSEYDCGAVSGEDSSHQVYVWDDRAYTPTEVVVE